MFKQEKGVTLVALVITIIVLLILAGVSISMVAGDNGVLTRASKSSKKTKYGAAVEAVNLACADLQSDYADAMAEGQASSANMASYYTEKKMVDSLANQGYELWKEPESGTTYTKLTSTNTITGEGDDAVATPLDVKVETTDTPKKYRVCVKGADKDYIELTFEKKSMGYSAIITENQLGGASVNE